MLRKRQSVIALSVDTVIAGRKNEFQTYAKCKQKNFTGGYDNTTWFSPKTAELNIDEIYL